MGRIINSTFMSIDGVVQNPQDLVGSDTDPWMRADSARAWSRLWGSHFVNLGDVGHINVESGFGPLPVTYSNVRSSSGSSML